MRLLVPAVVVVVLASLGPRPRAQALAFDVASVKANTLGENSVGFGFPQGGLTATNMPLRALIIQAYKSNEYELLNLPDWAANERFDIAAKTTRPEASGDDRLAMLQALLEERFALKMHAETREMATYSLLFARQDQRLGPNLRRSTVDCVARSRVGGPAPPSPGLRAGGPGTQQLECGRAAVPVRVVESRHAADRRLMAGGRATARTSQI
jgi:uncharacterized protein (TIGR03435 family)